MLYSILLYGPEAALTHLSKEEDAAAIAQHEPLQRKLLAEGRLGPVMRLMPTTDAKTLRAAPQPLVVDGPFAETKEQLLGLYVVDCANVQDAIEAARQIPQSCWSSLEIRPVSWYHPGVARVEPAASASGPKRAVG
jgi:hypothetical protein